VGTDLEVGDLVDCLPVGMALGVALVVVARTGAILASHRDDGQTDRVITVRNRAREDLNTRTEHRSCATSAGPGADDRTYCRHHRWQLFNRYYDPASYQFLSIDPKVGTTLQPYAFVGGDPLNDTDPLGLKKRHRRGTSGSRSPSGPSRHSSSRSTRHSGANAGRGLPIAASRAATSAAIGAGATGQASGFFNSAGSAAHLSDDSLLNNALWSVGLSNASRAIAGAGTVIVIANDQSQGDGVAYTAGDAGGGLLGSFLGGTYASMACGGPEDGVGVACGVAGAVGGGAVGSKVGSSFMSNLANALSGNW